MLLSKHPILFAAIATCLVGVLSSCANSPTGEALERSFAPDPQLTDNPTIFGDSRQNVPENQASEQLPEDFPSEIPHYPEAQLERVETLTVPDERGKQTVWVSSDPRDKILDFYQREFESGSWEVISQANEENEEGVRTLMVQRNDVQVTVSIPTAGTTPNSTETPSSTQATVERDPEVTEFTIQYIYNSTVATADSPNSQEAVSSETSSQPTLSKQPQTFSDLEQISPSSRQAVEDLAALGVLTLDPSGAKNNTDTTKSQFEPNKTLTRREYVRWLVAANNQIYANRPGLQIRLASKSTQPAFQDVPQTDPDFQSIQALAETGLIPSSLTGEATAVQFRPDAPLTRENLILWKVPLDSRQGLPIASIDAVQQTWGFQDVGKIDPKALRAVLADFQNGDQSNIRRVFGYTTLFQPKKPVTRAEGTVALWYFGSPGEGISAQEALSLKSQNTQATSESVPSN